jgi:hypothetical protein
VAHRTAVFVAFVVAILVAGEAVKFLGGVPWRGAAAAPWAPVIWDPHFRCAFANDLNLPHWFNIVAVLFQPVQRGTDETLLAYLAGAAFYTWRRRPSGSCRGLLGPAGHDLRAFRLAERAFVPYVVAVDHPDRRARADDRLRSGRWRAW